MSAITVANIIDPRALLYCASMCIHEIRRLGWRDCVTKQLQSHSQRGLWRRDCNSYKHDSYCAGASSFNQPGLSIRGAGQKNFSSGDKNGHCSEQQTVARMRIAGRLSGVCSSLVIRKVNHAAARKLKRGRTPLPNCFLFFTPYFTKQERREKRTKKSPDWRAKQSSSLGTWIHHKGILPSRLSWSINLKATR